MKQPLTLLLIKYTHEDVCPEFDSGIKRVNAGSCPAAARYGTFYKDKN